MIKEKDFRTYRRRDIVNTSGYKVAGDNTGGEAIILASEKYVTSNKEEVFNFYRKSIELEELFESNIGMIAGGGYIFTEHAVEIRMKMSYKDSNSNEFETKQILIKSTNPNTWNNFGFHKEISLDLIQNLDDIKLEIKDVKLEIKIVNLFQDQNTLQFIGFDFDGVTFEYYKSLEAMKYFKQKTSMHIPHIYYLSTGLSFSEYLTDDGKVFQFGDDVVLKGCNRCSRYLPININDVLNTLAFSLHCKKKAPCKHSLFDNYKIENINDLSPQQLNKDYITKDNKIVSYYGHQLECKPCKKFFVNAALNPKRSSQQFKEDGLRRRALELLSNNLLQRDLIHHEFEHKTKKQFSEHIWNKFNKRCFKCGKKLALDEMHLDHTMPLAYLYRLDETASCLCASDNSSKRDSFPVDFYSTKELSELQEITGIDPVILNSKIANPEVVRLLTKNVTWFFDIFLNNPNYQKVLDERLVSDKIYASIVRVLGEDIDLLNIYYQENKKYPSTITVFEGK